MSGLHFLYLGTAGGEQVSCDALVDYVEMAERDLATAVDQRGNMTQVTDHGACQRCGSNSPTRVAYYSQSEDELDRSWRKQSNAEAKLGEHWARPKGMHHKTRDRLMLTIRKCEEMRDRALAAFIVPHGWLLGSKVS